MSLIISQANQNPSCQSFVHNLQSNLIAVLRQMSSIDTFYSQTAINADILHLLNNSCYFSHLVSSCSSIGDVSIESLSSGLNYQLSDFKVFTDTPPASAPEPQSDLIEEEADDGFGLCGLFNEDDCVSDPRESRSSHSVYRVDRSVNQSSRFINILRHNDCDVSVDQGSFVMVNLEKASQSIVTSTDRVKPYSGIVFKIMDINNVGGVPSASLVGFDSLTSQILNCVIATEVLSPLSPSSLQYSLGGAMFDSSIINSKCVGELVSILNLLYASLSRSLARGICVSLVNFSKIDDVVSASDFCDLLEDVFNQKCELVVQNGESIPNVCSLWKGQDHDFGLIEGKMSAISNFVSNLFRSL
ncbi:hypothetical protein GEMRC1_011755 [Eukaryota sp. GEM-RC1]